MNHRETYLNTILEANPTGIIIVDKETRKIVYVNNAAAKMIEAPGEEIKNKICHNYVCPSDACRCPVHDLGQVVDRSERILIKADGTAVPILKTVVPINIKGKECLLESFIDISERKRDIEKLKQSEERYRTIFEHTGNASILVDEKTTILLANSDFAKLSGYSKEELEDKINWTIFVDGEDLPRIKQYHEMRRGKAPGLAPASYEFRFVTRHGAKREISATIGMIPDTNISIASLMDITQRRQAEEANKKSEKYYKALTESAFDVLFILSKEGTIKYVTPSVEWIMGYSPQELLGKGAFDLITPEDHLRAAKDFSKAILTKDMLLFDSFRVRHKYGHVIILEGRGKNLLHDPVIAGFVMNVRDVTKSIWAMEALRESEKKFRSIVENAFDCILIMDEQRTIKFANNAALHTIKVPAEKLVGSNITEFIAPDSMENVSKDFTETANGYDSQLSQYYIINGQDEKICVESIGKLINYEGEPAVILSLRDVTERRRAEEEKANLQGQLLQAQKMESIGRLAGGVAHDFNNMLGIIHGHAELAVLKTDADHPVHANLRQIIDAAERSANLTRQLLAFARKQTISPKVLEVNDLVAGMLKLLRRLIGEDIALAWLPGSNVWPIKMDPSQIDQILANLCVNARDAISNIGKVTIETRNVNLDEEYCSSHTGCVPGDYVLLGVSDNGSGMDKETMSKIFEPFFTTKVLGKGTGLGLSTVYGIVKQNNGFIDVCSEPDGGTTFSIYLPKHMEQVGRIQTEEVQKLSVGNNEMVLIVEDEPILMDMIRIMLESIGYRVLAAQTPHQAISLAKEYADKIDLLLTDVVLPEMNGRELANEMFSLHPDLKCLFMSGYTANVIAHHGVLDEGVSFIQKPIAINTLAVKIRELLDQVK